MVFQFLFFFSGAVIFCSRLAHPSQTTCLFVCRSTGGYKRTSASRPSRLTKLSTTSNRCRLKSERKHVFFSDHRYFIEEKDEPHLRTRVGMEASCRWEARHTFAAFDVPVPGSSALDVHYTVRSTDSLNPYPEQCRISLKVSGFEAGGNRRRLAQVSFNNPWCKK